MDESRPTYLRCSQAALNELIDAASLALGGALDGPAADPYDIGLLIDALRVLAPQLPAADMFDGMLHVALGNFDDAVRVFAEIANGRTNAIYGKALLAFALQLKRDPEWRIAADEVLAAGSPAQAVALVRALERQHDVLLAKEHADRTGVWELPESAAAANGDATDGAGGANAALANPAGGFDAQAAFAHQQYLRL
ncbi:HrpB1 family type III secretion system apparatus protein [Burkholderia ubonensis]|uniref:HrpB1 family type III secretion system apparatus protein n=1 Tax=Burkholderia ubonensis TaxID=101571 RepID=UPI00075C7614|nr:HrpB1 family type III secretion system apparatus protein [Burkholderia ubonensis]KWB60475.1 type III secretion protein [Burkholderia ubonensis]